MTRLNEPRRLCAICGMVLREGKWIYSPTTGERYCPPNRFQQCEERSLLRTLGKKTAA